MSTENLYETLVDAFHCAASALDASQAEMMRKQASTNQLTQAIPEAVEACLRAGLVDGGERDLLASTLSDPVATVHFVTKMANFWRESQRAPVLGEPAGQARARDHGVPGSASSNRPGAISSQLRESDYRWLENLGVVIS